VCCETSVYDPARSSVPATCCCEAIVVRTTVAVAVVLFEPVAVAGAPPDASASRPRQCGEVALPERAMIRDTEGYHPHGRMQAKTPVNVSHSRSLELQPGIGPGGRTRPLRHPPRPARSPKQALRSSGLGHSPPT